MRYILITTPDGGPDASRDYRLWNLARESPDWHPLDEEWDDGLNGFIAEVSRDDEELGNAVLLAELIGNHADVAKAVTGWVEFHGEETDELFVAAHASGTALSLNPGLSAIPGVFVYEFKHVANTAFFEAFESFIKNPNATNFDAVCNKISQPVPCEVTLGNLKHDIGNSLTHIAMLCEGWALQGWRLDYLSDQGGLAPACSQLTVGEASELFKARHLLYGGDCADTAPAPQPSFVELAQQSIDKLTTGGRARNAQEALDRVRALLPLTDENAPPEAADDAVWQAHSLWTSARDALKAICATETSSETELASLAQRLRSSDPISVWVGAIYEALSDVVTDLREKTVS